MRFKLNRYVPILAICWICAAGNSFAQGCTTNSVAPFIRQFYAASGHPSSVPSSAELRQPESPFSQRLRKLLLAAAMAREDFVSVFPDHPTGDGESLVYKPPFVDGDIFQGSPDGSLGFEIAEVRGTSGGSWQVRVRSVEEPGMSPWDVTVEVEQESKRCVIDDVIYGSSLGAHSLAASLRRNVKLVQSEVAAERKRSTAHGHSCATVGDC